MPASSTRAQTGAGGGRPTALERSAKNRAASRRRSDHVEKPGGGPPLKTRGDTRGGIYLDLYGIPGRAFLGAAPPDGRRRKPAGRGGHGFRLNSARPALFSGLLSATRISVRFPARWPAPGRLSRDAIFSFHPGVGAARGADGPLPRLPGARHFDLIDVRSVSLGHNVVYLADLPGDCAGAQRGLEPALPAGRFQTRGQKGRNRQPGGDVDGGGALVSD